MDFAQTYGVQEHLVKVLRLYISRAIYSRIHDLCFKYHQADSIEQDEIYNARIVDLRGVAPEKLDPSIALVRNMVSCVLPLP